MNNLNCIKIDLSNQENNKILASQNIESKKLILRQNPITSMTFFESRGIICDFCLKNLIEKFQCQLCKFKYYCSVQCLSRDKEMHNQQECKVIQNIQNKNYSPNTLFLMTLRIFIQQKFNKRESLISEFKNCFDQLEENKKEFVIEMSLIILKYLQEIDQKLYELKQENKKQLQELICKIMCNSFTIEDEFSQQKKALSIYSTINYINHSCDPNCVQIYDNNILQIYTLKNIKEGEEITISYMDNLCNRMERRIFLKENYLFNCECSKCHKETDQQEIKCSCGKALIYAQQLICTECKKLYSLDQFIQIIQKVKDLKNFILNQNIDNQQILEQKIINYEFVFQNIASKNYYHLQSLQYLILDLYSYEKFEVSVKYLIRLVGLLEKVININSPVLGWKYCEIAKLTFYLKKCSKSKEYSEKSFAILQIYYDSQNKQIRELNERYLYVLQVLQEEEQQNQKYFK